MKVIIRPFQKVLLEKGLCVGCTYPLDKAKKLGDLSKNREVIQCKCKRRYIFDKESNQYQRATLAEEQQILKELERN